MNIADSFASVLSPPHRAGYPFVVGGLVLALVGLLFWGLLAWIGLVFTLFCLYFFRDPERVAPSRPGVFLAPADGLVVVVDRAAPPPELGLGPELRPRVAIFLSVLDVHVNRMPAAGTVTHIAYRPGLFLNAALDKASVDNERNAVAIRLADGTEIAVVQIAGLIARRIVCEATLGQTVVAGARYGIIRFGSRTDLYLPAASVPLVAVGQRMIGGETVIAESVPMEPAELVLPAAPGPAAPVQAAPVQAAPGPAAMLDP